MGSQNPYLNQVRLRSALGPHLGSGSLGQPGPYRPAETAWAWPVPSHPPPLRAQVVLNYSRRCFVAISKVKQKLQILIASCFYLIQYLFKSSYLSCLLSLKIILKTIIANKYKRALKVLYKYLFLIFFFFLSFATIKLLNNKCFL